MLLLISSLSIKAQDNAAASPEELAKKLANPIASLINVPFQNYTDYDIGPNNGVKNTLNFQPGIPVKLSPKLTLITRVVLPIVTQYNVTSAYSKQSGLSDAVVSAFFSPAGKNGVVWGIGPALLIPTATDPLLGTKKLGLGPTGVILKQAGHLTFGALVNQLWSVAGDKDRANVSQFFIQPFITPNWKSGAGIGLSAEVTKNWQSNTTTAFIMPNVSGVTKLGKQIISLSFGARIPVAAPILKRAITFIPLT